MSKLQPVRGTRDIFGQDAQRFAKVVETFHHLARLYGFQPVDTPVFEFTELFARGIGETTDVVSKEMYTFPDRGGESLTLRPEFTAGLCRAYISNGWQQLAPLKLAAHGPMFRYERPQKGRYRQFHQIDAEILGAGEPQADIELLTMAAHLLDELGLAGKIQLEINTLGDTDSRARWREALLAYFSGHQDALSEDSKNRLHKNPLRILDSKDEGDRKLVADAPLLDQFLSAEAGQFFETVLKGLEAVGIAYVQQPRLVRGLDYYCHTTFEFTTTHLGAQGTVIGGGRYDGLIGQLGGPATPAIGWAGGIERLALLVDLPEAAKGPIAVIPLGEAAQGPATALTARLRRAGFRVEQGFRGNMKRRLSRANDAKSPVALILGEDELARGELMLKDLDSGEQRAVPLAEVEAALQPYQD